MTLPGPFTLARSPPPRFRGEAPYHRRMSGASLPGAGCLRDIGWHASLLKVSGANEIGEPNGEPTSTGIKPHQATSSHSRGWQMPHRATSSHVQRRYVLALQARGHWFETSCAHCFRSSGLCWDLRMVVSEPNGEPKSSALCHGFGLTSRPWARRGLDLLRRREEPVCRRGLARPCR